MFYAFFFTEVFFRKSFVVAFPCSVVFFHCFVVVSLFFCCGMLCAAMCGARAGAVPGAQEPGYQGPRFPTGLPKVPRIAPLTPAGTELPPPLPVNLNRSPAGQSGPYCKFMSSVVSIFSSRLPLDPPQRAYKSTVF